MNDAEKVLLLSAIGHLEIARISLDAAERAIDAVQISVDNIRISSRCNDALSELTAHVATSALTKASNLLNSALHI